MSKTLFTLYFIAQSLFTTIHALGEGNDMSQSMDMDVDDKQGFQQRVHSAHVAAEPQVMTCRTCHSLWCYQVVQNAPGYSKDGMEKYADQAVQNGYSPCYHTKAPGPDLGEGTTFALFYSSGKLDFSKIPRGMDIQAPIKIGYQPDPMESKKVDYVDLTIFGQFHEWVHDTAYYGRPSPHSNQIFILSNIIPRSPSLNPTLNLESLSMAFHSDPNFKVDLNFRSFGILQLRSFNMIYGRLETIDWSSIPTNMHTLRLDDVDVEALIGPGNTINLSGMTERKPEGGPELTIVISHRDNVECPTLVKEPAGGKVSLHNIHCY